MNRRYCPESMSHKETADLLKTRARKAPVKKVIIEVRGGVAYAARVPKGVSVEIIDHDNLEGC